MMLSCLAQELECCLHCMSLSAIGQGADIQEEGARETIGIQWKMSSKVEEATTALAETPPAMEKAI